VNPPPGCHFHPRCPARFGPCDKETPQLLSIGDGAKVRCHLYDPKYKDQITEDGKKAKALGVVEEKQDTIADEFANEAPAAVAAS
jgi:hypothetical protein